MSVLDSVPNNWNAVPLGTVGTIVTGSTPTTNDRSNYGREYLFASPADLGSSKYVTKTEKMLSRKGFSRSRIVPAGSTLFVCIGSTIGKVGIAAMDLATNQQINSVVPGSRVDPEYLYYAATTLSKVVRDQAGEQAVPLVNKSEFSTFEILLPPIDEQRTISGAIADADRLIGALERILAKKRAIKQGMMQQLLTGRTRLPGFGRSWAPRRLGDLLAYEQPGRYLVSSTDYGNVGTPVLTAGKTFVLGYTTEEPGIYSALPAIIFDDFTTASKFVDFPFKAKSSAMKILSARRGESLRYIYERMQLIDFSVVDHKRRWIAEYSKLEVEMPDAEEQVAVATVLDDVADGIIALRERLAKARSIKQGMMQQLLTGRTRLSVEEDAP